MTLPTATLGPPTLERLTVLCVDDNPALLECYQLFLESFGYTVLAAPSGMAAVELALANAVDLAMLDYHLPDMTGAQVAVELKRLDPELPIILLSGDPQIPAADRGLTDCFISKGQEGALLLPLIAELIGVPKFAPQSASADSAPIRGRRYSA